MRTLFIYLVYLFLSFSGYSQAREDNGDTFYLGGIDSLRYDLGKNIVNSISDLDKDYFVFFEISVSNKGSILARELYRKSDATSSKVIKAIEATSLKWKMKDSNKKIIIPIFLLNDQEDNVQTSKLYTYTQRNYPFTGEIVNGFLMAPIIINYYRHEKNATSVSLQNASMMKRDRRTVIVCGDDFEVLDDWRTTNVFVRDKFQNTGFKK